MGTFRRHVHIERPPDDVWAVIRRYGDVADWFPAFVSSAADGRHRTVTLASGLTIDEEVVTCDDEMRRFQYRLLGPLPVTSHLASIDVLDAPGGGSTVVYSTDVVPHALALVLAGPVREALAQLKHDLEEV